VPVGRRLANPGLCASPSEIFHPPPPTPSPPPQMREARFYATQSIVGALPRSMTLRVLYAHYSEWRGEYVLLMEDLALHGAVPVNVLLQATRKPTGDDVHAGGAARDPAPLLRASFQRAADLHGSFWGQQALLRMPWLKRNQLGVNRGVWEASVAHAVAGWHRAKELLLQPPSTVNFSARMVALVDASAAATSWDGLRAHLRDPKVPLSLCHGDFYAANVLVRAGDPLSAEAVLVVDWSEVGPWEPTADIAQFLITRLKVDVLTSTTLVETAPALVRAYWDRLIQNGGGGEDDLGSLCRPAPYPHPCS
jgi:hypothetical protein